MCAQGQSAAPHNFVHNFSKTLPQVNWQRPLSFQSSAISVEMNWDDIGSYDRLRDATSAVNVGGQSGWPIKSSI